MKAYISYAYTPEIKYILQQERIINTSEIIINGKKYSSNKKLPDELLTDLIKTGKAVINHTQRVTYEGKNKVFDVPRTRSRTITIDGDKYIQIRVIADDITELMENVKEIKNQMLRYGIQAKTCYWGSMGKLNAKR